MVSVNTSILHSQVRTSLRVATVVMEITKVESNLAGYILENSRVVGDFVV